MTSWIGMLGPGCGPTQELSSGTTITGGVAGTDTTSPTDKPIWSH